MKHLKSIPLIFVLLSAYCSYSQDAPKNYFERKAVNMVKSLKEVIKAEAYFKTTKNPLHVYIDGQLGKDYEVRVAQFKGGAVTMTFTQYVFLVDPRLNTIKYWDIPADTIVSIAGWRKNNYAIDRMDSKNRDSKHK